VAQLIDAKTALASDLRCQLTPHLHSVESYEILVELGGELVWVDGQGIQRITTGVELACLRD